MRKGYSNVEYPDISKTEWQPDLTTCKHCGHRWHYKGQSIFSACLSCRRYTQTLPDPFFNERRANKSKKLARCECGHEWWTSNKSRKITCVECGRSVNLKPLLGINSGTRLARTELSVLEAMEIHSKPLIAADIVRLIPTKASASAIFTVCSKLLKTKLISAELVKREDNMKVGRHWKYLYSLTPKGRERLEYLRKVVKVENPT